MRLLLAAVIAMLSFATAASSQTIVVRGGEHGDFTRIVLELPIESGWSIMTSPATALLTLTRPGLSFDLSAAYERIGRTRLVSLTSPNGGSLLKFDLACDCRVEGTMHESRLLVVDIYDGAYPQQSRRLSFALNPDDVQISQDMEYGF